MEKVLVTGGTGFLGSAIVKALLETKKYNVTALDINPPSLGTASYPDVNYVRASVLDIESIQKAIETAEPAVVIHTVGVYHTDGRRYNQAGREELFGINVTGTKNVLEAAREFGVKSFVYTSSWAVVMDDLEFDHPNMDEDSPVGHASLLYGQSKTAAENIVLGANTSQFRTCALRPSVIIGPGDPATIPILHACIRKGETPFIIGSGHNLTDFVYVSNIADAHILAVSNLLTTGSAAGEAFFITNGEPISMRDFCLAVWVEFGHVPWFEIRIPESLAWGLGWAAECVTWFTEQPATLSRGAVKDACLSRYANIDKARRVLGYEPRVGLAEGTKLACQEYKNRISHKR
ncbi:C-3 sterol dehydrogenase/C-4 decarboxylase-like protein [Lophium mytilinum]|uniref:C-3 sterol dehydrogenase/C-4 decarboxylase-like protein n=1 Tax=Lophium mytilinum TaxID=390894 RepID=A0A6A6R5P0_9PEZI|nr:C-3 sterol dehydrogenase/C-4 decarboxylase-like protein [Lophium mytilinum]